MTGLDVGEREAIRVTNLVLAQADPQLDSGQGHRSVSVTGFDEIWSDPHLPLHTSIVQLIAAETGLSIANVRRGAAGSAVAAERADPLGAVVATSTDTKRAEDESLLSRAESLRPNWALLEGNYELSRTYLRFMQHFGGVKIDPSLKTKIAKGLSRSQVETIAGGDARISVLTDLFTQGWAEFSETGFDSVVVFEGLEEALFEQLVWGNPTAARNQLRVGVGWPENALGLVDRASGMLLYDEIGHPIPAIGGGGLMRDEGWVGAQRASDFGINLANIEDPAIRQLLNSLRQTFGEPTRVVAQGASAYFENVELVHERVATGLTSAAEAELKKALPMFIGFLAGHGLATLLMRVPNPIVAGIGISLKGLLTAAGYVMSLDFAGHAMANLLRAGRHLARIRKDDSGALTSISQFHLNEASAILRQMVAQVALSIGTAGATKLLAGRLTLTCSKCQISRTRSRRNRRKAAGGHLGYTKSQIAAMRRLVTQRSRLRLSDLKRGRRGGDRAHQGRTGHQVPDHLVLQAVNKPGAVLVAKNGNWLFYRAGTIVVTRANQPAHIITAFGRGGRVPQRNVADMNRRHPGGGSGPNKEWRVGDPERAVRIDKFIAEQSAPRPKRPDGRPAAYPPDSAVFRIWP